MTPGPPGPSGCRVPREHTECEGVESDWCSVFPLGACTKRGAGGVILRRGGPRRALICRRKTDASSEGGAPFGGVEAKTSHENKEQALGAGQGTGNPLPPLVLDRRHSRDCEDPDTSVPTVKHEANLLGEVASAGEGYDAPSSLMCLFPCLALAPGGGLLRAPSRTSQPTFGHH